MDQTTESRARFFPTTGGVLKTMAQDAPGYTYLALDGVDNCMAALKDCPGFMLLRRGKEEKTVHFE